MLLSIQDFIVHRLGARFVEPPTFDLGLSYRDSRCFTPLVFVLSPGADPLQTLFKFAQGKSEFFLEK